MSSSHHHGSWAELQQWLSGQPPLRAVVCDIYGTLLQVSNPPPEAGKWLHPALGTEALNHRLAELVREDHEQLQDPFPEVDWVKLFGRCFPDVSSRARLARLARHHARLQRRCQLAAGAAEFIRNSSVPLALCSNAQAYTLMELRLALRQHGLRLGRFDLGKSFFSYRHGTAKPNPLIFQRLHAAWGAPASALLMVGDRKDNDILPAQQAGWSTWEII